MRLRRGIHALQITIVVLFVGVFATAAAESHRDFVAGKKTGKKPAYALQASVGKKKPVFDVRNAAPGDTGSKRVTLTNVGTKASRIETRRIRMLKSPLTEYLSLSIYDSTTRNCLYPKPKKRKPVKRGTKVLNPKPTGPCKTTSQWRNLAARWDIPPKTKGKYVVSGKAGRRWKPREKHVLVVTWAISPKAPNAAAGKRSNFTLRWLARHD